MDVHFNAYKARYEILDKYFRTIQRVQYTNNIDIFINLDDVLHIMHRPLVEKEFQVASVHAWSQCTANILNLVAHYKQWAAKQKMKCRIFLIYTSYQGEFKNSIYLEGYRHYYRGLNDPANTSYFFINDAVSKALPFVHTICDYIEDVFAIDSKYLEPSIIPMALIRLGYANYTWKMMVSRDHYDLQYAYKHNWIFISPKGDNTRIINRSNLWRYIGDREHVTDIGHNSAFYHHELFPLALGVAGNKLRDIPRLRRIGWKTIFKYLDSITEQDTESIQTIRDRLVNLLMDKGVSDTALNANLNCVNVDQQSFLMNRIDDAFISDQLKFVTDHEALGRLNVSYFEQFPINIPFLTAKYQSSNPFKW